jgi:hypothetical protein
VLTYLGRELIIARESRSAERRFANGVVLSPAYAGSRLTVLS